MNKTWKRRVRLAGLVAVHIFVAGLSLRCGQMDSVSHGPFLMRVPTPAGNYVNRVEVNFFLDEEVKDGEMIGWIRGAGCPAWVTLCDGGVCEIVYETWADGIEETFVLDSENSYVFSNFLDSFVPCYKDGGEMWQEPFGCQRLSCEDSKEDIEIFFEAECAASLQVIISADYFDERTPFKGCIE